MLLGLTLLLLAVSYGPAVRAEVDSAVTLRAVPKRAGFMVPLRQRDVPTRRRHLLRSGALDVQGSVREVGYFYTTLKLGTPARDFAVIIDTGSTITYIPCKGCAHCGKHTAEWFDPDASSTSKKLGCTDPLCNCGSPSCSCKNNRCYYARTYAERSSSEGWMIEDTFGFPDEKPPVRMVFGCEDGETGEIYRQMADGIMGMGNNHNAFQSQLVQRGVIEDIFSLCFGYPQNGLLLLGDVPLPKGANTVYTPLVTDMHLHYYNVKMEGITVDGQKLPLDMSMFDRGYGVVLDSGTTFTYLPGDAFKIMAQAIGRYAEAHGLKSTPGADPQYNDICWKGAPQSFDELHTVFPPAEFIFGGDAHLVLPPVRYLFLSRPSEYCLGIFDNGISGTLIGGVSVRDVVITYDRRNHRVGFTSMACEKVAADVASRPRSANITVVGSPPPPSPPPPSPPPPSPPPPSSPPPSPPPPPSPSPPTSTAPADTASQTSPTANSPATNTPEHQSSAAPEQPQSVLKNPTNGIAVAGEQSVEVPETGTVGGTSTASAHGATNATTTTASEGGYTPKPLPSTPREKSVNLGLLFGVVLGIGVMFVVSELVFFRKTVLVTWWDRAVMQYRGAQDSTELAPLSDANRQP